MYILYSLVGICFATVYCSSIGSWTDDMRADKWRIQAKNNIDKVLEQRRNPKIAKNILFFLGDGMGIATVTSGRIRKGQLKNNPGEEEITVMESLDNHAFSKVYFFFYFFLEATTIIVCLNFRLIISMRRLLIPLEQPQLTCLVSKHVLE